MNFEKDYLEDDQSEEIQEDIFLKDFLIEFICDAFYCNGEKVTIEEMIDKIDFYTNVIDNLKDFKKEIIQPLNVPIFNMNIEINLLIETIDKFNL